MSGFFRFGINSRGFFELNIDYDLHGLLEFLVYRMDPRVSGLNLSALRFFSEGAVLGIGCGCGEPLHIAERDAGGSGIARSSE